MNQQHSSSATISGTRSNKRVRGGNTERKDNGISQNSPSTVPTDDHKCANGNEVSQNAATAHSNINTNRDDDINMTISHIGNNKRPRSRSNSTGHLPQSSMDDFGGSIDTVDRNNNNEDKLAVQNSATANSTSRRKVPSQGKNFVE